MKNADLGSNIASTLQAGCFFGCFLTSWIADKWGRKTALIFNGLLTMVGVIIQTCSFGSLPSMYVGRYVTTHSSPENLISHLV